MAESNSPVLAVQKEGRVAGVRLCLFGNGSSALLPEHKHWISNYFVPKLKNNPYSWIDFVGHSSPSGNASKNLSLSKTRIDTVEAFVKSVHPGVKVNVKRADGASDASSFGITTASSNQGYWRAVVIYWFGITDTIMVPAYQREMVGWMKRVYRLIPQVETWRTAAVKVLDLAKASVGNGTPSEDQKQAMALVDRVFQISKNPGQTADQTKSDLDKIKNVFFQMKLLIQAIISGDQYLHENTDPDHEKDIAYTIPGRFSRRNPDDGVYYVRSKIEPATEEFIIDATVHEFAHFCGPSGADAVDHAHVGGKPAYGALALGLSKSDAMKNASSYAWLAYLARKPASQWLTAT